MSDKLAKTKDKEIVLTEQQAYDRLQDVEDSLRTESLLVLSDAMAFADIDPKDENPPAEWIKMLGLKRAEQRFRVAKAAWESAKEAPVGIKVAAQIWAAILKVRSGDSGIKPLNMTLVNVVAKNAPIYDEQEVED